MISRRRRKRLERTTGRKTKGTMGKGVPKPKLQPPAAVHTLRDSVTKTRTGITSNTPRRAAMTAEERRKSLNEGRMDKQEWEKTESQVS